MSEAKELDARLLYWQDELTGLSDKNRQQVSRAMAKSLGDTLRDLRSAYGKFNATEGESNRYTIENQTARYRQLVRAADGLLSPATIKQVESIYNRDLQAAYEMGGTSANDLAKLTGESDSNIQRLNKMPVAAQMRAGSRLNAFWEKEAVQLRDKVTEATLNALQRGKGWNAAQKDIAAALRSNGQTILRSNDELSVTARGGIVMNLEQRADLIARTELANAYIEGQMTQYRKNGYTHGRWSAAGERTCAYCASREGVVYPLDELDGAIPAHPRCRCTVAPVLGENVEKVNQASDKKAAAAQWLDDTGWTAIRQQRHSEYLKFTGKSSFDPAKYLNTPTSREKFLKGPDAKAAQPSWTPSGQATPDLEAAEAAAQRAKQVVPEEKLTPEEQIVADVMNNPSFKTDAQRTREMRARLGKAGLDRDQDFVALAANAREKGAFSKEAKAQQKDLSQQQAEAEKAKQLQEADEKRAKTDRERQELKEKRAEKNGELKVVNATMKPLDKQLNTLKGQRETLDAERNTRRDVERRLKDAEERSNNAAQERGQAALKLHTSKTALQNAKEKLANLKPSKAGGKFDIDAYDLEIGSQNHSMESLIKIGQDVLRRAGVTLQEVKTPAASNGYNNLTSEELDVAKASLSAALRGIEAYKKNGARSRKNIKTLKANEEYRIDRTRRDLESGRINQQEHDDRVKMIRENTKKGIENEQNYLDNIPARIKELEGKRDRAKRELAMHEEGGKDSAAQKVIDELVSTSPITRAEAGRLVEEAAKRNRIDAGKNKQMLSKIKLRPVPTDQGLDHMADAVFMYGTRSSMDVYGLSSERAHAHTRKTNRVTGERAVGYDKKPELGYVNSGKGFRDFRATQFHELGHHLEFQNTDFYRAARQFIDARKPTPDARPKWLGAGYGRDEVGYQGKAYNPYVLKEYDLRRVKEVDVYMPGYAKEQARKDSYAWQTGKDYTGLHQRLGLATEVVSMGVEKLSSSYHLQRLAEQDSEHLLLSIGMVKVQQARAKMKMDRFDRARDQATPVATAKDVPDGTKGGSGSETQAKRLKEEITTLEKGVKELQATADKLAKVSTDSAKEALDIFEELKKYRPMEQIRADQEALEDAIMNLSIERSPFLKEQRELERQIDEIDKTLKKLESSAG